ncbi:type IV secretion system protein VirB10 [Burkholderia sp. HI2761]|uniref:type IV secretion system protein VirB10 n=1 Tax=unclassified Burkholderia TaxID=2613784 RepID=UPI000B7A0A96|nr:MULTISPECIES: type IV secretion system protein VirB10 [unclassified Burkholderia]MPV59459.1 type IV secretion system protein VirB10 [Burkholderia sp. BE24]OXJ23318.1 type IV secretion system protein VirB10 [Burkholderia sp. HI2761]
MIDETSRHGTSPHDNREPNQTDLSGPDSLTVLDRGLPSLDGQGRRSIAGWLIPLVIIMLALAGAVWTVHVVLSRHDAAERARRNTVRAQDTHDKVFEIDPALAEIAGAASAVPAPSTAVSASRAAVVVDRIGPAHSYYDAPLLVVAARESEPGDMKEAASVAAGAAQAHVSGQTGGADQGTFSSLAQALVPTRTPKVNAAFIGNRSLLLSQGTKIDCAGDTAFDSTQAGISTCTVTRNIYSDDGRVVLIERGSQINCEYRANLAPGQKRVFVLSARIVTPHGVIVQIDSPVADALGRMGVAGALDNHWGERVGAAMLLGLSQDAIGYLATRGGNANGTIVYQSTQAQGNDMATRVLDQTINIAPTLKQNQGAEFTIVLARDLDFSSVYTLEPEGVR